MRKLTCFCFFFWVFIVSSFAQPTLDEILPEKGCSGKKAIASFNINGEKNEYAIDLINLILIHEKTKDTYRESLYELNSEIELQLDGKDNLQDLLGYIKKSLIKNGTKTDGGFRTIKNKIACSVATFLHQDFINNPGQLRKNGLTESYNYYKGNTRSSSGRRAKITASADRGEKPAEKLGDIGEIEKMRRDIDSIKNQSGIGFGGLFFWTLLVGAGVYFLMKKQFGNIIDKLRDEIITPDISRKLNELNRPDNGGNRGSSMPIGDFVKRQEFTRELSELKSEIRRIKSQSLRPNHDQKPSVNVQPYRQPEEKIVPLNPIGLYSPPPTKDGLFYGNQLNQSFKEGNSFYVILPDMNDPTIAEFSLIHDDNVIRQAAGIPGSYLIPGCQLRGPGSLKNGKNIQMQSGRLIKQSDNWKILEKAIVTWE